MILVVDDDASFLELASKILNRDRRVFLASDAQRAFQLAENLGFSIALVDLDLKGTSGLSLIKGLQKSFLDLAIIAISRVLSEQNDMIARKLGAAEVLRKTHHARLEACCGTRARLAGFQLKFQVADTTWRTRGAGWGGGGRRQKCRRH